MNIEDIKAKLKDRRVFIISQETGLHPNTIRNIRDGKSTDPKNSTIELLREYLGR